MINALEQALNARQIEQQMGLRQQQASIQQQEAEREAQLFPFKRNLLGLNVQKEQFGLEEARRQQALKMAAASGNRNALIALNPAMALEGQKLDQQKKYQDEQLRLKGLEVDPFGMLGGRVPGGGPSGAPINSGVMGTTPTVPAAPSNGMQGAKGNDQAIAGLPKQIQDQVRALADGRLGFPSGFALKSPYWQKMISLVSEYDPSFDAINFNARAATRKDFTSGKAANNLTAINTAIGHLGSLQQAGEALKNGNYPLLNTALNKIATEFGDPRVNNFEIARNAVGDELMRVFRQVGASETEAKSWRDRLSSSASPDQLQGALKMAGELLESRVNALNQQYEKGMGKSADTLKVVYPKSREVLDRIMGGKSAKPAGAPEVGTVVDGYKFKGGNPSDKANWEKQ